MSTKRRLKPAIRYGFTGFLIALILCAGLSIGGCFTFMNAQERTQINSTTLKTSLEQASDLITTKYYYSDIGKFENSYEINGWSIPFTGKNFILSYQGQALLGFSTKDADVKVSGNRITVNCPPIEILSNSIPAETVEVYDQSFNIFNQVTIDDYLKFETEQKTKAEEKMKNSGVFDKAAEDAKTAITQLLNMIPEVREHYKLEINVESQPESAPESSTQDSSSPAEGADTAQSESSSQSSGSEKQPSSSKPEEDSQSESSESSESSENLEDAG